MIYLSSRHHGCSNSLSYSVQKGYMRVTPEVLLFHPSERLETLCRMLVGYISLMANRLLFLLLFPVQIPSDNCSFDEKPDMKAREICEAGKEAMLSKKYDMIRINFANPDMVGHTGNLEATISCCTLVDKCVKEIMDLCSEVRRADKLLVN